MYVLSACSLLARDNSLRAARPRGCCWSHFSPWLCSPSSKRPMQPDDEDDVPEDLVCPITFSLMTDPVVCVEDGRVYECAALASALALSP